MERWAEAHRAELVVFIVLPISWWIWLFRTIKRKCSAPKPSEHLARVRAVCAAVVSNAASSDKLMRTDRSVYESLSTRNSDKTQVNQVPLRALHAILGLDDDGVLHCEPGVTVGEATRYLLARKRMLECTLEMEDATLGGLAMAQGMTTHSHVCGLLHETVVEWELVLGDGRNVVVRRDNEHADLFDALPLSHGSIGLLVGIKIRTTPSKPWVRLTYTPVKGDVAAAFSDAMRRGRGESSDSGGASGASEAPFFVEGIAFARDEAVIMTGVLADAPTAAAPANRIGYWFKPWFYKHVESVNTASRASTLTAPLVESIPILDYLMRHDRSMCMTMGTVIPYGNHPLFRLSLGWMLPPQMSFLKASHTPETRDAAIFEQVYQDISMPLDQLDAALTKSHELFEIYPLLVYPCALAKRGQGMVRTGGAALSDDGAARRERGVATGTFDGVAKATEVAAGVAAEVTDCVASLPRDAIQLNANLGIYGVPRELRERPNEPCAVVTKVRELEAWVRSVGGFQHTYCDSFQTRMEFEEMFDHEGGWRAVRAKYGAEGKFPSVYEKTRPEVDVWGRLEMEKALLAAAPAAEEEEGGAAKRDE